MRKSHLIVLGVCILVVALFGIDNKNVDKESVGVVKERRDDENPCLKYEKYFQMKQGELARIEKLEDLSECGKFGFLNSHFGGVVFRIDEGVLVQYSNDIVSDIDEELLPRSLIIMDSSLNLGFMDARAGMDFEEIQKNAYVGEIQEGFMYSWEEKVYYIRYTDEYYEYTFFSGDQDGSDSWLIVSHKQEREN
ncbi:MAG: hypothetical protein J6K48_05850 [Lachnospiraceae bacterium]|nr:hypothetical protein [Lachnospiraceae bacterium]